MKFWKALFGKREDKYLLQFQRRVEAEQKEYQERVRADERKYRPFLNRAAFFANELGFSPVKMHVNGITAISIEVSESLFISYVEKVRPKKIFARQVRLWDEGMTYYYFVPLISEEGSDYYLQTLSIELSSGPDILNRIAPYKREENVQPPFKELNDFYVNERVWVEHTLIE